MLSILRDDPKLMIWSANRSFLEVAQTIDFDKLYVTYPDLSSHIWGLRGVILYQPVAIVKSYLHHLPSFA